MTEEEGAHLPSLSQRTEDVCEQLMRYGGAVANEALLAALETIAAINDDMHHARSAELIWREINEAKGQLDLVLRDY